MGIKIVRSIDVAQSKASKQMSSLVHSSQTPVPTKNCIEESKNLLEELGVSSRQFKIFFDNVPQGVAVYKMVYNQKGIPVDFILLENIGCTMIFIILKENESDGWQPSLTHK